MLTSQLKKLCCTLHRVDAKTQMCSIKWQRRLSVCSQPLPQTPHCPHPIPTPFRFAFDSIDDVLVCHF